MKYTVFLLFITLPGLPAYGQPGPSQSPVPSHRFLVCSVNKATEKLETQPFRTVAEDSVSLFYANQSAWENYLSGDSTLTGKQKSRLSERADYPRRSRLEAVSGGQGELVPTYANAIAAAMVLAYAEHRPLVLSPDMVWLLLLQGFSAHIEAHPEQMRPYFVDFEGTRQLTIERSWLKGDPNNDWEGVFEEFGDKIAKNTKNGLAEVCLPSFSTTGKIEKAAFDVSLMRAVDEYFDYEVRLICGIPEITLEGTPEDWALLEVHAAGLARYDLDWWIKPLQPILHEFSRASQGLVDTTFWQDMVKKREYSVVCSSQPFLTGWMLHFFPYLKDKPNPWLVMPDSVRLFEQAFTAAAAAEAKAIKEYQTTQITAAWYEPKTIQPEQFGLSTLDVSSLPSSMSKANVRLDDHGAAYALEFLAGCIGIRQDDTTLALRPEFGWRILDKGLYGQSAAQMYSAFARKRKK